MGITLMADDRDLIIGELREGVRTIKEHLRRQDDAALVRDQQTEASKREAIVARERDKREVVEHQERLHAENLSKFQSIEEKATITYGIASWAKRWIDQTGDPMAKEWGAFKDKERAEEAESRGSAKTWAFIVGIASAIGTVLAAVITYGKDAIDFIRGAGNG